MDRIEVCRLFLRIAEKRSFSAGAAALRIKQSTASKWISALEAELGVTLLERTPRALRLTAAGERFLAGATGIVDRFDELAVELRDRSGEPAGRLRISAPVVFGPRFVAPVLARVLREQPRIEVELVLSDRYVNLVEDGFDVAVRIGMPVSSSERGLKLFECRRYLVASPEYLLRHPEPRAPRDLERHQCLVHTEAGRTSIWRFFDEADREHHVTVGARITANNSEATLEFARAGLGIALLADFVVDESIAAGQLAVLLPRHRTLSAPVYALTPPGRHRSAAVRAVLAAFQAHLRGSRSA